MATIDKTSLSTPECQIPEPTERNLNTTGILRGTSRDGYSMILKHSTE